MYPGEPWISIYLSGLNHSPMIRKLLLFTCLSISFAAFAQEPSKAELAPCGTPAGISPWLKAYTSDPDMTLTERSEDTIWVALQVHLLGKNNGSGRFSYDQTLDAICRLNQDFGASNIQFYLKNPINLINNTGWYNHSTIPQGIDMMLTNNAPGALNSYFVGDPAGNCGYNLPYGGVAIAHGCATATDHTWAHEVGHALSLPHPFIGWEGKTYNYNNPTPTSLTYDYTYFHDTLDTQVPAPLDTALVELVDGSNCQEAADLFCDTKPDYLSYRWNCNAQQTSTVKQKDPQGVDFYSDGTLFMSYADDACQSRFSPMQIEAMRANLMSEKIDWVAPAELEPVVTDLAVPVEPVQGQPAPVSGAKLVWHPVPKATHYLVQASRLANFLAREVDIVTTDTSAVIGTLSLNKTYYWRIKAFNAWHICSSFNGASTFLTVPVTSTYAPDWEGWRIYPSLMAAGQPLHLELPENWRGQEAQVRIFDVSGRLLWEQYIRLQGPKMTVPVPSENWQSGMYHFVLTSDAGIKRQPIFIER